MNEFKDAELSLIVEALGVYSKYLGMSFKDHECEEKREDIRVLLIKLMNENMKRWRAV